MTELSPGRTLVRFVWAARWKMIAKRKHRLLKAELAGTKKLHSLLAEARAEIVALRGGPARKTAR